MNPTVAQQRVFCLALHSPADWSHTWAGAGMGRAQLKALLRAEGQGPNPQEMDPAGAGASGCPGRGGLSDTRVRCPVIPGSSMPLNPSAVLVESFPSPEPAAPVSNMSVLCVQASKLEILPCLLFTFSVNETGFKNTPHHSATGLWHSSHSQGGWRAPLHLVSPFCLNIMPHPD